MRTRIVILYLLLCLLSGKLSAQTKADDILGTYRVASPFNDDVAKVLVSRTAKGTYQGRVTWTNHPTNPDGSVRTDSKNPDKKLRQRRYDEVIMFYDLVFEEGEWVKGKLYDPYSGMTFNVKFKPVKKSRNLKARYYKGIPAIGIDGDWVRENN